MHHCSRKNVVNHPAGLIRLLAYSLGLLELPTRTELPLSPPQLIFIEAVLNFNGAESANSVRNIFRLMHHPVLVIASSRWLIIHFLIQTPVSSTKYLNTLKKTILYLVILDVTTISTLMTICNANSVKFGCGMFRQALRVDGIHCCANERFFWGRNW